MKKAFMLVAAVAFLAAPVFAEVEVAITGEATTTFGFDLDTEAYGLNSDVSSDITLTVGAMDGESMGEGNWYGVIELTGASLKWDSDATSEDYFVYADDGDDDVDDLAYGALVDGEVHPYYVTVEDNYAITAPSVAAKITNGNVYVKLQSEASLDADFVVGVDEEESDYEEAYGTEGSLTIGGTFAMVTAAVELATAGDYDTDKESGVALEADLKAVFEPVTVEFDWTGGFGDDVANDMAFAAQVTADVAPVKVVAAFDGEKYDGVDLVWETSVDVDVTLDPITVGANWYYTEDLMNAKVAVGYDADPATADAYVMLADMTGDLGWEIGLEATYKVNSGIKLAAAFSVDSDEVIAASASATFTELVDNVEFKLGWRDGDDLTNDNVGEIFASAKISY